jgi:hypothetical protein
MNWPNGTTDANIPAAAASQVSLTWTAYDPGLQSNVYSSGFVKLYVCPADPTNSTNLPVTGIASGSGASSTNNWVGCSYAANFQLFGSRTDPVTPGAPITNFPANWVAPYGIGNIPDGGSNTIMIGEKYSNYSSSSITFTDSKGNLETAANLAYWPANYPEDGPSGYTFTPTAGTTPPQPNPQYAAIFGFTNDPAVSLITYAPAYPKPYNPAPGPNQLLSPWLPPQIRVQPALADFRLVQGGHTAVVQVVMGDGSVRGVSASVADPSWSNAINPADHQSLGPDWND